MLFKAFVVASKAHRGQKDKAGRAYILHPVNVALRVKGRKQKTVALLHDVVEDTGITISDLEKLGFDSEVVRAVYAITKKSDESYKQYLNRVKDNEIAKSVKVADLKHNSNLKRLKCVTAKDEARKEKYNKAMAFLLMNNDESHKKYCENL